MAPIFNNCLTFSFDGIIFLIFIDTVSDTSLVHVTVSSRKVDRMCVV